VLWDAQHCPTVVCQAGGHSSVTLAIAVNLVNPKLTTLLWRLVAIRTPMPETAINKDDDFLARKYQVRFADQTPACKGRVAFVREVPQAMPPQT